MLAWITCSLQILSFNSSSSVVSPLALQNTCDPYSSRSSPCLTGNLVQYAVNATCADDVASALRFAQRHNIRVVIKNTGHDLLGKSTGKGGLGIWTHYLKSVSTFQYSGSQYNGPAVRIGAGVQTFEILEQITSKQLRIVGGSCPSVGVAGGYTTGGGHSTLSSLHGLAADNVLEWEVVTASGDHIVASPTSHSDLYWALSGGGGSSFAVILSMTVKAYQDGPVSAAQLSWSGANISSDTFWKGIEIYHNHLPTWTAQGGMATYTIANGVFFLQPLSFPDKPVSFVNATITPFLNDLKSAGIPYALQLTTHPSYLEYYSVYFGPLPFGPYPSAQIQGARLVPLKTLTQRNTEYTSTLKNIVSDGTFRIVGFGLNVSHPPQHDNAVLPAWRDAAIHMQISTSWNFSLGFDEMAAREARITNELVPAVEAVTPDSGAYLNEGDPHQPNWQATFYGSNYQKLLRVKRRWDPLSLFYAPTAVGADSWRVAGDGRLCRI